MKHSRTFVLTVCTIIAAVVETRSQFLPTTFEILQGFALEGHVIKTLPVFLAECVLVCQDTLKCFSMNVYKDGNEHDMCDLNGSTKEHSPQSFVRKTGYRYVQTSDATYLTICSKKPCQHDGECILQGGPFEYVCNCSGGYAGRNCEQKCVVFDFENGLAEWTLTGAAFNNQPTYGDNPTARKRLGQPSNHKGDWWIGTFENRPSPSHPGGAIQKDGPVGTMTSPKFIIKGTKLRFLIGGGNNINIERVELLIGGTVIARATGAQTETMVQKSFHVTSYRGKIAQFRVIDGSSGGWGHINVDHIEDSICLE